MIAVASVACGDSNKSDKAGNEPSEHSAETARYGLSAKQAAQPLVKLPNKTLTVGAFADQLANQSKYLRARYRSPEQRKKFLESWIEFELLAAEAERAGYMASAEVQHASKQYLIAELTRREVDLKVPVESVTEEEIRNYYKAHADEFKQPEQRRIAQIVVKTQALAKRLLKAAQKLSDDHDAFEQLVKKHSTHAASREADGDMGFFSRSVAPTRTPNLTIPQSVVEAAFTVREVGTVYDRVIQSEDGFHVFKVTGKRKELDRSFDGARRSIQNRLWRNKREARRDKFIRELRKDIGVEVYPERLSKVTISANPSMTDSTSQGPQK